MSVQDELRELSRALDAWQEAAIVAAIDYIDELESENARLRAELAKKENA